MTKAKSTKRALLLSALSMLICISMLIGTTFAWFTDSVTSSGNIIKSGKLEVKMYWKDAGDNIAQAEYKDAEQGAIFNYEKWEPGYVDAKYIKIVNDGTLAFKYQVLIEATDTVSELANVIDVYFAEGEQAISRGLTELTRVGTLSEVLKGMPANMSGDLLEDQEDVVTIALKMQESAGNEYQEKSIGSAFAVKLFATQLTSEKDSFDDQYDKDSAYVIPVSDIKSFLMAVDNGDDVLLENTLNVDAAFINEMSAHYGINTLASDTTEIVKDAVINGNGTTVYRTEETVGKPLFNVATGYTLTLSDITLDGGAKWEGEVDKTLGRSITNTGIKTTANLVVLQDNAHIVLNEGAILQNNDGAAALYPSFKSEATVTLNGAWIINNNAGAGAAIWGGGHITVNEGSKINGNYASGDGGAIRMVSGRNLTVNGGEINHNKAVGSGGVIWGYGSSVYTFTGGEMAYNEANLGGTIYFGDYSEFYLSGDAEIHDNTDAVGGGAFRVTNYTIFKMTGGKIYNNVCTGNSLYNAFYGWCPRITISGGELADNITIDGTHTPTIGGSGITGIVNSSIGTNHQTIYLTPEFGTIKFIVDDAANLSKFNFKPAAEYVYAEGDEEKLVCLNEGYSTYWDATTSTFRLQAN